MSCEQLFFDGLRQRGLRLTPQREMVLLALHQMGRPASAEEIYTRVGQQSTAVELSTVYRSLDLMVSMQIVSSIDTPENQRLFALTANEPPHVHLVCRICGKIIGVNLAVMQPLIEQIAAESGFQMDFHNLTVPGVCRNCA